MQLEKAGDIHLGNLAIYRIFMGIGHKIPPPQMGRNVIVTYLAKAHLCGAPHSVWGFVYSLCQEEEGGGQFPQKSPGYPDQQKHPPPPSSSFVLVAEQAATHLMLLSILWPLWGFPAAACSRAEPAGT